MIALNARLCNGCIAADAMAADASSCLAIVNGDDEGQER